MNLWRRCVVENHMCKERKSEPTFEILSSILGSVINSLPHGLNEVFRYHVIITHVSKS